MDEPLAPAWLVTIGEYLQEESERQWFWFSIFIVTLLVGALWLQSSLTLPGVHTSALLEEGETLEEVVWNDAGTYALLHVARSDDSPLRLLTVDGDVTVIPGASVSDISLTDSGWLVVGDAGYFAHFDGSQLTEVNLTWSDGEARDLVGVATRNGETGFLISKQGAETLIHTFAEGVVSEGSAASVETTVMTDVHLRDDGGMAIVIGYDTALGNPTFGPAGEVVMRAEAVLGQAPVLTLIHHGAGGAIHTALFIEGGNWGDDVEMVIAGSTSTMLLMSDSTIRDLTEVPGSTATAIDASGVIWFADGDSPELYSLDSSDVQIRTHSLPSTEVVGATHAATNSEGVVFYGDGVKGDLVVLQFDPTAGDSVSTSLARLGDLAFILIALFCVVMVGHIFYENGLRPW